MFQDKISKRYAKAIFDFAGTAEKIRPLLAELQSVQALVESNPHLTNVLTTNRCGVKDRRAILEALAEKLKLAEDTRRILIVLSASSRLGCLSEILKRLRLNLLEFEDTVPVSIVTANVLLLDEKQWIESKFEKVLGKRVEAHYTVSPEIMGGLKAEAAGKTYDASLAGWIESFHDKLILG